MATVERFQNQVELWRERRQPRVTQGPVQSGDIRGTLDPRDNSDFRLLCVLTDPTADSATVALVDLERVFAARSDVIVPSRSAFSTVPFEVVVDGILHFQLPVTALGSCIGRVDDQVVQAVLSGEVDDLPEPLATGSLISGPLDIRWRFKSLQISLMRALSAHHGPYVEEFRDFFVDVGAILDEIAGDGDPSWLVQGLPEIDTKKATQPPASVMRLFIDQMLGELELWEREGGSNGRLVGEWCLKYLGSTVRQHTAQSVPLDRSNIRQFVRVEV